ncbi:MAG: hypothetical protein Q9190_005565, partial [Brigantiaea leucoxantha]
MSDSEPDEELLALLRQSLSVNPQQTPEGPAETKVLESASYIYDHSLSVAISSDATKAAAAHIWHLMREKRYSPQTWSSHELHPDPTTPESTVNFIFLMDLWNFSFWSSSADPAKRFSVSYRDREWTGYWSLVACIQRALDDGIPITTPTFWLDEENCTDALLTHIFRPSSSSSPDAEPIPLLQERIRLLREAGQ